MLRLVVVADKSTRGCNPFAARCWMPFRHINTPRFVFSGDQPRFQFQTTRRLNSNKHGGQSPFGCATEQVFFNLDMCISDRGLPFCRLMHWEDVQHRNGRFYTGKDRLLYSPGHEMSGKCCYGTGKSHGWTCPGEPRGAIETYCVIALSKALACHPILDSW